MNITDFDFNLPDSLIAQTPLKDRTSSRLLVLNKETQEIKHEKFSDLKGYLKKGDCLLLNDTRVLPARLYGVKTGTGAKIEVLLLHQEEKDYWEALVKPAKKVKVGTTLSFGDGQLQATCVGIEEQGGRLFQFSYEGIFYEVLEELGNMPLPPYIKTELQEKDRYQTVYAKEDGSAAAPTAGLHFTKELMEEIKALGVTIAYITLHVGLGTFRPVQVDTIEEHNMHSEYYRMSSETAKVLTETQNKLGRIITVGTTSTRVLETIAKDNDGAFASASGWTDLFVYPPYKFQAADAMLTNFHLPKSTLIMLVCAFGGKSNVMHAYEEAVKNNYRFFSFGDAMLIL